MKPEIHPTYYNDCIVTCACGNRFTVGSTKKEIHVDICSACHPFFTGQQKFVDTEGRVERFQRKMTEAAKTKAVFEARKAAKKKIRETEKTAPRTLNELKTEEKETENPPSESSAS